LPLMEKVLADMNSQDAKVYRTVSDLFADNKILLRRTDGVSSVVDYNDIRSTLLKKKVQLRDAMALHGKYNEWEIAKTLNIEVDNAMGNQGAEGWILYGTKSFSQPELISVRYKPVSMSDAEA